MLFAWIYLGPSYNVLVYRKLVHTLRNIYYYFKRNTTSRITESIYYVTTIHSTTDETTY